MFEEISHTYEPNPPSRGSIRSMPIEIATDHNKGAFHLQVPLRLTKSRALTPQLALQYHSSQGNGEFGLGFSLSGIINIFRSRKYGVPTYDDEKDIFMLSDSGELMQIDRKNNIIFYRPRLERNFSSIEYHTIERYWIIREANGVNHCLGKDSNSRIVESERIFQWSVSETRDVYGNQIRYQYKKEGLEATHIRSACQAFYLVSIEYGNYTKNKKLAFGFKCIIDYGEYNALEKNLENNPLWIADQSDRQDQFIDHKAGFPIIIKNLCRRILLYHFFDEASCLVKYWELAYYQAKSNCAVSLLESIQEFGCRMNSVGKYLTQSLPPTKFSFFNLDSIDSALVPFELEPMQSLKNLNGSYRWVDLYRDGLPGIMYHDGYTSLYWRSESNGQFSSPKEVKPYPSHLHFYGTTHARFMHLGSEKKTALVVMNGEDVGYYLLDEEALKVKEDVYQVVFSGEKKFVTLPLSFADPLNELIDLNGSGKSDLISLHTDYPHVFTEADTVGDGFNEAKLLNLPFDFPRSTEDPLAFIGFVDIFGDGLLHRVKVSFDGIDIWPNVGHGKFLSKIRWPLPLTLQEQVQFDPARVFFVDVDGSGASDFIYVGSKTISLFLNQGSHFSKNELLLNFPEHEQYTHHDQLLFGDFLGRGVSSVILIKRDIQQVRYYMGSFVTKKPYLLKSMVESSGLQTELSYTTTTATYLQDCRRFPNMNIRLPFALAVLDTLSVTDPTTNIVQKTDYEYHYGVYDFLEHRFCGFAYVIEKISERLQENQLNIKTSEKIIKSWFYNRALNDVIKQYPGFIDHPFGVSAYVNLDINNQYYQYPENNQELPLATLSGKLSHQSKFSLHSCLLKQEIWGESQSVPVSVILQNYNVRCIVLPTKDLDGVFVIQLREVYKIIYEQKNTEPRITRQLNLEYDEYNNLLKFLMISYGKRELLQISDKLLNDSTLQADQVAILNPLLTKSYILLTHSQYVFVDIDTFKFLHLKSNVRSYDLSQSILPRAEHLYIDIKIWMQDANKILLQQIRFLYWNDQQDNLAKFGTSGKRGLLHHREFLLGNSEQVQIWYQPLLSQNETIDELLRIKNGYSVETGEQGMKIWWKSEFISHYGNADEFFQLNKTSSINNATDLSLFHLTTYKRDRYQLFITKETKYLTSVDIDPAIKIKKFTTEFVIDYVVFKPCKIVDHNQNSQIMLWDLLGQLIAYTEYGSLNGRIIGNPLSSEFPLTSALLSERSFDLYRILSSAGLEDILADPAYYLQSYLHVHYYNLNSDVERPRMMLELIKTDYNEKALSLSMSPQNRIRINIHYFNGFGSLLQSSYKTNDRAADEQWLSSGVMVYNKRGNLIRQSLPQYKTTAVYARGDLSTQNGVLSNFYDANSNLILQILPSGYQRQFIYGPWHQVFYDQNTMADRNQGEQELSKSDAITFINSQGSFTAYLKQSKVQNNGHLLSMTMYNVLGQIIAQQDSRLTLPNLQVVYNLLGNIVSRYSVDRGIENYCYNYQETLIRKKLGKWTQIIKVDSWQRSLEKAIFSDGIQPITIEKTYYGEMTDNPEVINACGQVIEYKNKDSILKRELFDLNGQCIQYKCHIYLPKITQSLLSDLQETHEPRPFDFKATSSKWYSEIFTFKAEFDAEGNLLSKSLPNNFISTRFHNSLSQINKIYIGQGEDLQLNEVVKSLNYNETGAIETILFGNQLLTTYNYHPLSQRIESIRTINYQGTVLRHNQYNFDPVGNLVTLHQAASNLPFTEADTFLFPEQELNYIYDDFYRISQAEGLELEHKKVTSNYKDINHRLLSQINHIKKYRQKFIYDKSGNLLKIDHKGLAAWYLDFTVEDDSNRFSELTTKDNRKIIPDDDHPLYDDAGNMLKLNEDTELNWNQANQLQKINTTIKPNQRESSEEVEEHYAYRGDAFQEVPFQNKLDNQADNPYSPGFFGKPFTPKIDSKPFAEYGNRLYKLTCFKKIDGSIEVIEQVFLGDYERKRIFSVLLDNLMEAVPNLIRHSLKMGSHEQPFFTYYCFDKDTYAREVDSPVSVGDTPVKYWQYHLADHLHSHVLDFDEAGKLLSAEAYQPYGQLGFILTNNVKQLYLRDYHYSNQMRDEVTGLYYYGARYYAPQFGRWLSPDPAGLVDSLNLYCFVKSNPLSGVDYYGFETDQKKGDAVSEAVRKGVFEFSDRATSKVATEGREITPYKRKQGGYGTVMHHERTKRMEQGSGRFAEKLRPKIGKFETAFEQKLPSWETTHFSYNDITYTLFSNEINTKSYLWSGAAVSTKAITQLSPGIQLQGGEGNRHLSLMLGAEAQSEVMYLVGKNSVGFFDLDIKASSSSAVGLKAGITVSEHRLPEVGIKANAMVKGAAVDGTIMLLDLSVPDTDKKLSLYLSLSGLFGAGAEASAGGFYDTKSGRYKFSLNAGVAAGIGLGASVGVEIRDRDPNNLSLFEKINREYESIIDTACRAVRFHYGMDSMP